MLIMEESKVFPFLGAAATTTHLHTVPGHSENSLSYKVVADHGLNCLKPFFLEKDIDV